MTVLELVLWAAVITMTVVAPAAVLAETARRAVARRLADRPARNPFAVSPHIAASRDQLRARAARTRAVRTP